MLSPLIVNSCNAEPVHFSEDCLCLPQRLFVSFQPVLSMYFICSALIIHNLNKALRCGRQGFLATSVLGKIFCPGFQIWQL
jgi:hypothetical protein